MQVRQSAPRAEGLSFEAFQGPQGDGCMDAPATCVSNGTHTVDVLWRKAMQSDPACMQARQSAPSTEGLSFEAYPEVQGDDFMDAPASPVSNGACGKQILSIKPI